jgi:hypothetical protein
MYADDYLSLLSSHRGIDLLAIPRCHAKGGMQDRTLKKEKKKEKKKVQ